MSRVPDPVEVELSATDRAAVEEITARRMARDDPKQHGRFLASLPSWRHHLRSVAGQYAVTKLFGVLPMFEGGPDGARCTLVLPVSKCRAHVASGIRRDEGFAWPRDEGLAERTVGIRAYVPSGTTRLAPAAVEIGGYVNRKTWDEARFPRIGPFGTYYTMPRERLLPIQVMLDHEGIEVLRQTGLFA